jgi:outer membrane lipoprotein SlyB
VLNKIITFFSIFLLTSCGTIMTTSSDKVSRDDTNKVLASDLGVVIDVVPVRIKGDTSQVGAVAGGIIGGIAGETVGSGSGQDIAIVAGSVIGGVIGYYSTVKLGEHNGFQYTIVLDETKDSVTIVQGESDDENYNFKVSDRVTIIYGNQIRVVKTNN